MASPKYQICFTIGYVKSEATWLLKQPRFSKLAFSYLAKSPVDSGQAQPFPLDIYSAPMHSLPFLVEAIGEMLCELEISEHSHPVLLLISNR